MSIRILLADDHRMFVDGLRLLLARRRDVEVVGEASDGAEAVRLAMEFRPDLVIMDISMPHLNGLEATRQIRAKLPGTHVLILSMHGDARYVTEALNAGASGYLLKDSAFTELAEAIRTVLRQRIALSERINDQVVRDYVSRLQSQSSSVFNLLSPREREVLQLIAEGHSTKETAGQLSISVKTVETHRKQIMDKLDLHTIAELTKYAIREGLTGLD